MSEDIRPGGTYKTLDEQREVLSPAEERFEKYRRTIGLFLGPLALLVMLLLPLVLPYERETGLTETIGEGLTKGLGVTSLFAITLLSTIVALIISETTSNTASATIVVPIVLPIAASAGVNPVIPALAAVFGASYGFKLPVSTPPNAIVYGSGLIPITKMIRSGAVFDLLGLILIPLGISVMAPLVGLA
jgi:di/tricarboxylate transporter